MVITYGYLSETNSVEKQFEGTLVCSFCEKLENEVKQLVAGPNVYICDECIEHCNEIINNDIQSIEKPQ